MTKPLGDAACGSSGSTQRLRVFLGQPCPPHRSWDPGASDGEKLAKLSIDIILKHPNWTRVTEESAGPSETQNHPLKPLSISMGTLRLDPGKKTRTPWEGLWIMQKET